MNLQRRRKAYSEVSSPAMTFRPTKKEYRQTGRRWNDDVQSEPPIPDWKKPMSPTRSLKKGVKSTARWTSEVFGSLYTVLAVLTGTTRTAVKVMQKKTPSFRNLRRLRKTAISSVKVDGKTWAKAAAAVLLLFFSTLAVYFFIHSLTQVSSYDDSNIGYTIEDSTTQTSTQPEFSTVLSKQAEKTLDGMIKDMVEFAVQNKVVELEDALHRATQHYCLPQLSERITLDKDALTNLDTELLLLIELLSTKRVELTDYHDDPSRLIVEKNGKLSFVEIEEWEKHKDTTDVAFECPLVTHIYEFTQGKSHIFLPQKTANKTSGSTDESSEVMTAAEFVAMIDDDDGTINGDIQAIVYSLMDILSDNGACADTGKALGMGKTPATMKITPGMRKVLQEIISTINRDSNKKIKAPVHVNSMGEVFWGQSKSKTATQCDDIAQIIADQQRIKGSKRIKAASLALLAHLYNVQEGEPVSALFVQKQEVKDLQKSQEKTETTRSVEKPIFAKKEEIQQEKKSEPQKSWTAQEVGQFVEKLTGDEQVKKSFAENIVDGTLYAELTDEILKSDFGIKQWGVRKKLLQSKPQ